MGKPMKASTLDDKYKLWRGVIGFTTLLAVLSVAMVGAHGCALLKGVFGSEMKAGMVDLSQAVVVSASKARPAERKAVAMLQDEVEKRTGIRWREVSKAPPNDVSAVVVASREHLPAFAKRFVGAGLVPTHRRAPTKVAPTDAEGYTLFVDTRSRKAPTVLAIGNDERGTLFAVGRLLRTLRMRQGRIEIDASTRIVTKPRYAIRGHQLGYRHISNTYDAWDVSKFEQFIRDMIVFGTNSIELIPALRPDEPKNELMPLTPWEMTVKLSELLDAYDLNVWLWLPVTDGDISKPEERQRVLANRDLLFSSLKRIDAVFVPGGDPGETPPQVLMPFLREIAEVLLRYHPKAEVWVSHQGFEIEERDWFYRYLQTEQPKWLTGVVYGPWTRDTLPNTRAQVPARYKIRHYPDITHCVRCQYPVPEWDFAFAATLGREPINPCPRRYAHIHNLYAPYTDGFITYSDGVNDDVNKVIWSALGWDTDADVRQILVEYGRYLIADELAEEIADGLLALEANWQGQLLTNEQVEKTLVLWRGMERRASEAVLNNWRFQQGLFRAEYDAYIQRRLMDETKLEAEAYERLREAERIGADAAIKAAQAVLVRSEARSEAECLQKNATPLSFVAEHKQRIEELGEALFKSIGMQLSVSRYLASGRERGAVLDSLDEPLNNREWLLARFQEILAMTDEKAKLAAINEILQWEDAGEGGFYDDLGNPTKEPHLVRGRWENDPSFFESAQDEFSIGIGRGKTWRLSWHTQGQTLYETPLQLRYKGLDPNASYILRVVYAGRFNPTMRLVANGRDEIHGPIEVSDPPKILEFPIPKEATKDGVLELSWHRVKGRGCQVAEVWLMKQ